MIYDQQENSVRNCLVHDAQLDEVPFTFELTAVPILQNEERTMCRDKQFLSESFIQNRFITGKGGQKFVFDDDIILNLYNATEEMHCKPEKDMIVKVSTKEAYGVNMGLQIC